MWILTYAKYFHPCETKYFLLVYHENEFESDSHMLSTCVFITILLSDRNQ